MQMNMSIIIINVTNQICYHAPRQKNIGILTRRTGQHSGRQALSPINYMDTHGKALHSA
ncbi:hypothetical protein ERHA54_18720 [Erwinia rhapontici]|uniref:Uncharacterized protein n=1 Tax=Erwinia rhapontici TaxID=55212 RepID=A0ABM7MZ77_ERWRD|nr:hypothetical protein [Erwinia rhapontici]MCS3605579.1 hypothetical protein [Erwinia rhapontici]TDS99875.1 hypothetical protein EDF84_103178 [Erwinia rhapontici]BCQ34433.1 hypothetical protein ERHA53_17760 [Erwinia rhapontici]BCQ39269.1 hypothetical protein ERHA54_18720 [Erwinia rhapontici]